MSRDAYEDPTSGLPHDVRTFWSVQCLRGIASLMIVIGHAQTAVARSGGHAFQRSTLLPWGASVDLFFVISGFVMVHASRRLFGNADGSRLFLTRRLARIVPLYWLATAAMLILLAIGSLKGGDRFPTLPAILASLAFLPFDSWGDGHLFPLLDLGWTLNYELFFYLVFAVFIGLPRRMAVIGVAATVTALAFAGLWGSPTGAAWFWTRPIMLDFVLGVGVGAAVAAGWTWSVPVRLSVGAIAIVLFSADPAGLFIGPTGFTVPNELPRVMLAGIPCAAILAAATLGPERPIPRAFGPLTLLGDASYSLYLVHPFVLVVLEKLIQKSALIRSMPGEILAIAAVVSAVALASATFRTIERPMTAWLTRRRGTVARANGESGVRESRSA